MARLVAARNGKTRAGEEAESYSFWQAVIEKLALTPEQLLDLVRALDLAPHCCCCVALHGYPARVETSACVPRAACARAAQLGAYDMFTRLFQRNLRERGELKRMVDEAVAL